MSSDPLVDAAALTGTLGLVAELRGDVERSALEATAEYRGWAAKQASKVLEETPKLAEHKIKAKVEGLPEFIEHKRRIARLEGDAVFLRAFFDAAMAKVQMIRVLVGEEVRRAGAESLPRNDRAAPRRIAAVTTTTNDLRARVRGVLAQEK